MNPFRHNGFASRKRIGSLLVFCFYSVSGFIPSASAKVYLSTEAFLQQVRTSQGCEPQRQTFYLSAEQKAKVARELGRSDARIGGVWVRYEWACPGKNKKWVYFDSHRVRTQAEALGFVVRQDQTVEHLEVLSFDEPEDYLPKERWFATLRGKRLSPALELQREIPMITGATLSARAAVESSRKILALHGVLQSQ